MTARADKGINMEYTLHSSAPVTKINTRFVLGSIVEPMNIFFLEGFGNRFRVKAISRVEAEVTNHYEMWILDVLRKAKYKIESGHGFRLTTSFVTIANVSVIVEGNGIAIIRIYTGSADAGTPKVPGDIFHESF